MVSDTKVYTLTIVKGIGKQFRELHHPSRSERISNYRHLEQIIQIWPSSLKVNWLNIGNWVIIHWTVEVMRILSLDFISICHVLITGRNYFNDMLMTSLLPLMTPFPVVLCQPPSLCHRGSSSNSLVQHSWSYISLIHLFSLSHLFSLFPSTGYPL